MQTEKKGFSKREKRLLLLLVVVALFAVMVMYIIVPLYNQLNDKTVMIGNLTMEKNRIETTIRYEDKARENRDAAYARYAEQQERFLNESLSNEVGRLLTSLCEDHALRPVSQKLSPARVFSTDGKVDESNDSVFLVISASMTVRGNYDSLKKMLGTVGETDYLRISRVSFDIPSTAQQEDAAGAGTGSAQGAQPGATQEERYDLDRLTVYFEVTMIKDNTQG